MDATADTVTIEVPGIPKSVMDRLAARARAAGESVSEYIRALIEREVGERPSMGKLDEVLAPVYQDFARSGMTEEELYEFFEEVREEVWQEKHGANKA